jgi:hypothetical protein
MKKKKEITHILNTVIGYTVPLKIYLKIRCKITCVILFHGSIIQVYDLGVHNYGRNNQAAIYPRRKPHRNQFSVFEEKSNNAKSNHHL